MADQANSRPIHRPMTRCTQCGAWQTVSSSSSLDFDALMRCGGCGGKLEAVDWEKHRASLPYKPYEKGDKKP